MVNPYVARKFAWIQDQDRLAFLHMHAYFPKFRGWTRLFEQITKAFVQAEHFLVQTRFWILEQIGELLVQTRLVQMVSAFETQSRFRRSRSCSASLNPVSRLSPKSGLLLSAGDRDPKILFFRGMAVFWRSNVKLLICDQCIQHGASGED